MTAQALRHTADERPTDRSRRYLQPVPTEGVGLAGSVTWSERVPAPSAPRLVARPATELGMARHQPALVVHPAKAVGTFILRGAAVLATLAVTLFLFLAVGADAGSTAPTTVEHVVVGGETLWDIAADYTAPGGDVRATVADIRAANGLDTSLIRSGQTIVIPVDR